VDSTVIKIDKNYTHSVWLSYVEVYNEKVYDLLADTSSLKAGTKAGPSTLLLSRKALAVKPSPPSDWDGSQNTGKYVAGLRQIRVHSAAQAKEILKLGQLHRKVFGTLANSQSSRSHALVTIKLLRCHRGDSHVRCCVHQESTPELTHNCHRTPRTYKPQDLHWWILQVQNVRRIRTHLESD
jgi:kinesin family protein 20